MSSQRARSHDADIRTWLLEEGHDVDEYTRTRINESYSHIERLLTRAPSPGRAMAFDVGCGPGYDSFGLAANFDRVRAIDNSFIRISAARKLARRTGVGRIDFKRAAAERYRPGAAFDFVYCNIMSDLTRSRRDVIARLCESTGPDGTIFYAESCEGYAPAELEAAIERRDGPGVRVRLRQIVNGVLGRPAFRFFVSGSARLIFEDAGFEVAASSQESWCGLVAAESLWLSRSHEAIAPPGTDRDYTTRGPRPGAVKETFAMAARGRRLNREDLLTQAEVDGDPLAPFLVLLVLAMAVPGAEPAKAGWILARARDKGSARWRPPDPDWDQAAELFARFRQLCQRGAEARSRVSPA